MIGLAYDKANMPRCKRSKWLSIADTLETCYRADHDGWRWRLPRAVELWMSNLAQYFRVA